MFYGNRLLAAIGAAGEAAELSHWLRPLWCANRRQETAVIVVQCIRVADHHLAVR